MATQDHTTRTCKSCNTEFPLTPEHWHKDKKATLGLSYKCKACAKAQSRQWLKDNPERAAAQKRVYYAENIEQFQAYRAANAEHIAQWKREWRKNNPELVREHKSDSQKRHRGAANERSRRFSKRHPEQVRKWVRIQQHRRRHAGGSFSARDVELQYKSQKGKCWHCGKLVGDKYHLDHLIPIARGGTNDPRNIVISCPPCNQSKGTKLTHEWNGKLF